MLKANVAKRVRLIFARVAHATVTQNWLFVSMACKITLVTVNRASRGTENIVKISMNVNNLEITMATFALNPIQFVSIPLVPTNVTAPRVIINLVKMKFLPFFNAIPLMSVLMPALVTLMPLVTIQAQEVTSANVKRDSPETEPIVLLFVKPAVKMEVNVLAPTSVHALMVFKAHCVKTTLMNVPWSPVCTNVPQIPHVSTSLDGIIASANPVSKHIRIRPWTAKLFVSTRMSAT